WIPSQDAQRSTNSRQGDPAAQQFRIELFGDGEETGNGIVEQKKKGMVASRSSSLQTFICKRWRSIRGRKEDSGCWVHNRGFGGCWVQTFKNFKLYIETMKLTSFLLCCACV